jgi:hypothetical protein
MADDKKPKIDLKSRLQRMGAPGGATPAPAPVNPGVSPSRPPPMGGRPIPPPSVPPPSGIPKPPASSTGMLDPTNPLAAVAQPFKQPAAPAPPVAQRIEVDEGAVHQARSSARRQGFLGGLVLAVVVGAVGWVGGTASQQGTDRKKSAQDAHDLSADLTKAKASLDTMKDKVTAGGKSILGDRKFPNDLGPALSGLVVDFGGDKLFGRRFSGVPADTTRLLMDFIARVQGLNDKKDLIVSLLSKLQKPVTAELARPAGQEPVTLVAVVDKDTPGGALRLASLVTPIGPSDQLPSDMLFANPIGAGNVKLPRLNDPKIPKDGAAIPVIPTSFDKVCPSPVKGAESQLISSMNSLIDDIQGQKGSDTGDVVTDSKPGLSEIAGKLADELGKVN